MGLRRTVLVIGAGAGEGKDIGMPVGDTLKVTIGKILARIDIDDLRRGLVGNLNIAKALEDQIRNSGQTNDTERYLRACGRIAQGMPLAESIDHFVNLHRDDAAIICCAKIAIVSCILAAEKNSNFYVNRPERDPKFNRGGLSKTWYTRFLQLLCRDMQFDGIRARLNSITFIIFNYDRCVETFLFDALKVQTGESDESIIEALKETTFIHPYGVVAPLPWQSRDGCVMFGNEDVSGRALELSKNIKTFHEQTSSQEELFFIHQAMSEADMIVFLGFAYHDINMELLYAEAPGSPKSILGTAFNIKSDNAEIIRNNLLPRLAQKYSPDIQLVDLDCAQFFDHFERRLAFS